MSGAQPRKPSASLASDDHDRRLLAPSHHEPEKMYIANTSSRYPVVQIPPSGQGTLAASDSPVVYNQPAAQGMPGVPDAPVRQGRAASMPMPMLMSESMQQNQNEAFRPQLDVGRFRQLLNTASQPPAHQQHGPPVAASAPKDPLYLEWKRIESGLKRFRLGRLGEPIALTAMTTYQDFKAHKSAFDEQMAEEDDQHDAFQAEWDNKNRALNRQPFVSSEMPAPLDGTSTVLGMPTVWTGVQAGLNPNREVAPWPGAEEFREEGDERHTSQFGRFLPFPRYGGNSTVNYKQAKFMPAEVLDRVNPVPGGRRFYQGLFYDRNGIPYDDERMCGKETIAFPEGNPFEAEKLAAMKNLFAASEDMSKAVVLHGASSDRDRLISELTSGDNRIVSRSERRERRRRATKAKHQLLELQEANPELTSHVEKLSEPSTATSSNSTVTTPLNALGTPQGRPNAANGAAYLPASHDQNQTQKQMPMQSPNRNCLAGHALASARFSSPANQQTPPVYTNPYSLPQSQQTPFQASFQQQQALFQALQQQQQQPYIPLAQKQHAEQIAQQIALLPVPIPLSQPPPTRDSAVTTLRNQTAVRSAAAKAQTGTQRKQHVQDIVAAHMSRTAVSSAVTAPLAIECGSGDTASASESGNNSPTRHLQSMGRDMDATVPSYTGPTSFPIIAANGCAMVFEPQAGQFVHLGYSGRDAADSVNGSPSVAGSASPERTGASTNETEYGCGDAHSCVKSSQLHSQSQSQSDISVEKFNLDAQNETAAESGAMVTFEEGDAEDVEAGDAEEYHRIVSSTEAGDVGQKLSVDDGEAYDHETVASVLHSVFGNEL